MNMKELRHVLAGAGCCALLFCPNSHAEGYMPAPVALQQTAREWMQRTQVPGLSMAGVENAAVQWQHHMGQAAPDRAIDDSTLFNVASLTKPLFGVLTLSVVADDELALDAPLAEHWVDPQLADDPRHKRLTARLALSHQTGLPNWRGDQPLSLRFDPGTAHEYSGEGYEYLRRALERATGESMPSLMRQHVTGPVQMSDTYFGWQDSFAERVAVGFDENAEPMDMAYLQTRGANAAASTFTNARDYAALAAWVSKGAGLPKELLSAMTTPQAQFDDPAEFFGLGWKLIRLENETVLMHDGREPGVRTLVVVRPAHQSAFVLLSNSSNTEAMFRPMIIAAFADGEAIMTRVDRDTWDYLQAMPSERHAGMIGFIARSPAFTQKLLYAVQVGALSDAALTPEQRQQARQAIADITRRSLAGELETPRVQALLQQLLTAEGTLIERLTPAQAERWLASLQAVAL